MTDAGFVLCNKAAVVLVCLGALGLGANGCRLRTGRIAGTGLALAVASVSLIHDAYRDILSVECLVLIYLLAVAVLPYRSWQVLGLGLLLTALFSVLGHHGLPGTRAAQPTLVQPGHLVRMGFATVVLTGVSALLYAIPHRQHAATLLEEGAETISDVAAAVGYRDPNYFSRLFRDAFGMFPFEYAEQAPDGPDIQPE
ncbi:MAG: helix-turn-helix domain-containing protein [Salinivenus sp.]